MMVTLPEILNKVKHVKAFSQTQLKLLQLAGRDDHSLQDMTRIISVDSAMTASVLKVANSAAFGAREPITSLAMAVARLGERFVVGIAIGAGSATALSEPLNGYDSRRGELWEHSLRTAIAAREFGRHAVHQPALDLAYTGGLLHDLGKLVISEFLRQEVAGKADAIQAELDKDTHHPDFLAIERRLIGTDHCQVGLALAREWRLPESLCAALAWHHAPGQAPAELQNLVYCVHGGDFVAMMAGGGTGVDSLRYPIDPGFYSHFKLPPGTVERVMLATQEEFVKTAGPLLGHG